MIFQVRMAVICGGLVGVNGGAAHGTVTMNNEGLYTYTPNANYNGNDTFTYKLCDTDVRLFDCKSDRLQSLRLMTCQKLSMTP